jgi:catechol 2,3-dioxygenase-like lactoylglutathione lyase family enzyme
MRTSYGSLQGRNRCINKRATGSVPAVAFALPNQRIGRFRLPDLSLSGEPGVNASFGKGINTGPSPLNFRKTRGVNKAKTPIPERDNKWPNIAVMEPIMPTSLSATWDHVHLRSSDPEATAQWFEHMLGAEVIRSTQQGKPRVDLKLGGAKIFIAPVVSGDGVNPAPTTPYQGLDHFGLSVVGIDAIAAELKHKGVEFTKEPHTARPGIRVCFLRGPQGISIELLERDPKYT